MTVAAQREEKKKDCSLYRDCKLFLSEDRFEVVRVDCGIASIPLFRINITSSSESIWFGAETTRVEPDDKVELEEVTWTTVLASGSIPW